jgi:hypothetical protein
MWASEQGKKFNVELFGDIKNKIQKIWNLLFKMVL